MKVLSVASVRELVKRHGFDQFMLDLIDVLKEDFSRWESFTKVPRPAMHVPGGVLELMPICDNEKFYTFKYVNCHPKNPLQGLQTVVATGQLARIDTGYPLLFTEMTLLTALRTGATAALATDFMARKNASIAAIIGNGAQSEFQIRGLQLVRDISEIRYFDVDEKAMDKFARNLKGVSSHLVRCSSVHEAVTGADITTVCTASKTNATVLENDWVASGMHINAMGGDTVGKTELEKEILYRSRIIVEYFTQSYIEGEIQHLTEKDAKKLVSAELHDVVTGKKKGRNNDQEITLFDSVGIALEDYSLLRLVSDLAEKYQIGENIQITPELLDPKDLYSLLIT